MIKYNIGFFSIENMAILVHMVQRYLPFLAVNLERMFLEVILETQLTPCRYMSRSGM
jgi:hypothetical protein